MDTSVKYDNILHLDGYLRTDALSLDTTTAHREKKRKTKKALLLLLKNLFGKRTFALPVFYFFSGMGKGKRAKFCPRTQNIKY